jgi:ketosteroid isomerase-like protein
VSQQNVQVVRKALDSINRRDLDMFLEDVDPDVVTDWSRAVGPERGVFRGADELVGFLRSWWGAFEESEMILDEVLDAGDQVVVAFHGRQRGRGSGAVVEGRGSVLVFGLRNGRVISVTLYQERHEALEAVGVNEHTRAAGRHERTADFWESEGRSDKAQAERDKARARRRAADAEERQGRQDRGTENQT